MNNFGHIEALNVIFFWKCSKFYVDFENGIKSCKKFYCFEDNCVWTCCGSFCQLLQEYMLSLINVLKSGPRVSDLTKGHDTQVNLFEINGTLA